MRTTVIELPEYIKRSEALLNQKECKNVIDYLSEHPKADRNALAKLVDILVKAALEKHYG